MWTTFNLLYGHCVDSGGVGEQHTGVQALGPGANSCSSLPTLQDTTGQVNTSAGSQQGTTGQGDALIFPFLKQS